MGESTAQIAQACTNDIFLGLEVHEPGVGALLKRIGELDLHNLRLISHDAVEILERMIAPNSLDGVHIFFPDPWHKTRHHKRRLIQKEFVELLVSRFEVVFPNNLPYSTENVTTPSAVIFAHKYACTFATQITESRIIDNPFSFGKLMQGLQVYGFNIIKPSFVGVDFIKNA